MHLLDTDTLTHLHAGHPRVVMNLGALADSEVGTTIVTKIEVLRARFDYVLKASEGDQLLRARRWLQRSEQLLAGLLTVPFDAAAAGEFDKLRQTKKLRKIGRADILIASIALANRATLVTRNTRHFQRVPNLNVVNWVD